MAKYSIKSDTKGKLEKMINGVVFSDPYVFVTEFFQNSYRAKATEVKVDIDFELGKITFSDNGKGLRRPTDLLTLDYSNWETTNEGFGIGFWSWLGFEMKDEDMEGINEVVCEIKSNEYNMHMSKEQLFRNFQPEADVETLEAPVDGFSVTLYSDIIKNTNVYNALKERVKVDGELMPYTVTLNGTLIPQKDLFAEVKGDFFKDFSTRYFDTRLTVDKNYGRIELYYEKRKVRDFYLDGNVSGVVELKKGCLNLKEPDRKDYNYDNKYFKFKSRLSDCVKSLYISFVEKADQKLINDYAQAISKILEVKDYEKFLEVGDVLLDRIEKVQQGETVQTVTEYEDTYLTSETPILVQNVAKLNNTEICDFLNTIDGLETSRWVNTGEVATTNETNYQPQQLTDEVVKKNDKLVIAGNVWRKISNKDLVHFSKEDKDVTNDVIIEIPEENKKTSLTEVMKQAKRKVWVKAGELEDLSELVATAKYYKIKVFVAKNIMYEEVFKQRKVPYITEVKDGITKRNIIKNVELRTKKERRFIQLLQPICNYYKLPYNTFLIGELEISVETKLDGKVIDKETLKNRKDDISVYGVTDGKRIVLDRRALALRNFHFSNTTEFGKNEFKALLSVINTLSHELAHLLYHTSDNTVEHFNKQDKIMEEIVKIYNSIA